MSKIVYIFLYADDAKVRLRPIWGYIEIPCRTTLTVQ